MTSHPRSCRLWTEKVILGAFHGELEVSEYATGGFTPLHFNGGNTKPEGKIYRGSFQIERA